MQKDVMKLRKSALIQKCYISLTVPHLFPIILSYMHLILKLRNMPNLASYWNCETLMETVCLALPLKKREFGDIYVYSDFHN